MFVDKVEVTIRAGKGGDGKLSFRHEKFVERGGPDGGDGGNGGDVYAEASNNQNTLASFRYKKLVAANPGDNGEKRKKHGRAGQNLVVKLPVGTVITTADGNVIADLTYNGQKELIAKGGKGGFGNAHFTSSTRQAPRIAEFGEPGEEFAAVFELKMIADIGLIGLPNAGKSTLLAKISNARPEIADYPFTTLKPNLGVVDIDKDTTVLFADIPGLIEGASQGKGLGDEFLRHVERTKLLVHLVDAYQDNIAQAYQTIIDELAAYSPKLAKKPQIVVINKIEGLDQEIIGDHINTIKKSAKRGTKILAISAHSGQGVQQLLFEIKKYLQKVAEKQAKTKRPEDELPVIKLPKLEADWRVVKRKNEFVVIGRKIERFASRTDFDSSAGVQRLRDIMRKMGIMNELERRQIKPGQKIIVDQNSLEY
ncbi:GTPase ObgE [Candidatus Parcubacteria bacterium]|nr:GTPase ObgE [Candidatus Parcubacteria bacterium]